MWKITAPVTLMLNIPLRYQKKFSQCFSYLINGRIKKYAINRYIMMAFWSTNKDSQFYCFYLALLWMLVWHWIGVHDYVLQFLGHFWNPYIKFSFLLDFNEYICNIFSSRVINQQSDKYKKYIPKVFVQIMRVDLK